MEKRVLLAIVLSFLVLILYQFIFFKKKPLPQVRPESATEVEKKPSGKELTPPLEIPKEIGVVGEERKLEAISAQSEEQVSVDTPLYRAIWSNKGGALKSWKLKKYKDDKGEDLELVSRRSSEINLFPFFLRTEDPSFDAMVNTVLYKSSHRALELKNGQKGELRFKYADEKGTQVEKVFNFEPGKYDFDVEMSVFKNGQKIAPHTLWGPGFSNLSPVEEKKRFGGGSGMAVFPPQKGGRLDEKKFISQKNWENLIQDQKNVFYFVQWAAYDNNYFAALFVTSPENSTAAFLREGTEENPHFLLSLSSPQRVFIGPKNLEVLREFGYESKRLVRFGMFGFIAEILLQASKFCYRLIPNWGVSIIILTVIIKILFFPLTYSSTRSMAKMQEIQPKIKALRAKYKKAKQDIAQRRTMNEEIMKLYKEHGINPAGGCLPILIQLPIFFGFYRILVVAIEYRHSPFILWIKDLSVSDPYYVTPILMGVSQFISQKVTPTSADPTQARLMLIMPFFFTFIFLNFQSGLVLYWLTNNVLQIIQQLIMNRMTKKKKRDLHGKGRKR